MKLGPSSPLRVGASASAILLLCAITAGLGGGCSTVSYRVPGLEVQRLANLPPQERGIDVRIVPENAPLYPSTQRLTPLAPPPIASPPPGPPGYGPDVVAVEDEPPPVVVEPSVYVDVEVPIGGHAHAAPPLHVVGARPPPNVAPPPARPGFTGTPVSGGGVRGSPPGTAPGGSGWRGSPVTSAPRVSPPSGGGWRGSPVASVPRAPGPGHVSVPSRSGGHTHSGGGGHHGGGGSSADAAIGAAVLIVGLVAIAAVAAANEEEADQASKFDGWVDVDPSHMLLLHYNNHYERKIPLNELRPRDAIGVQYGELWADEGPVVLKPPAQKAPAQAAPVAAVRPVSTAPAPIPATVAPAAMPAAPAWTPPPPPTSPPPLQPAPAAPPAQPTS